MENGTNMDRGHVEDVRKATPGSEEATPAYTTGEAARALGITSSRVRKMIRRGELTSHRDEQGRHRIPREAVRVKLEEHGDVPPTRPRSTEDPEGVREPNEPREEGGLQEKLDSVRQDVLGLAREVRALRGELVPLSRLARTAEEEKANALMECDVLREERVRLLSSLEEERRKAEGLQEEYDTFRLKWWSNKAGPGTAGEQAT